MICLSFNMKSAAMCFGGDLKHGEVWENMSINGSLYISCGHKLDTVKPVLSSHSNRRPKLVFKPSYRLMQVKVLQNAPREHSAKLSTFIKLPFVFKSFVLSIFEWPLETGFTVYRIMVHFNP